MTLIYLEFLILIMIHVYPLVRVLILSASSFYVTHQQRDCYTRFISFLE